MKALVTAVRDVMAASGVTAEEVVALSLDTTGSSVIFVDAQMQPLDEYMLWCDHRAHKEAKEITELAHALGLEAIEWCGGVYSHEWGFAKLLYWLRHTIRRSGREVCQTALEHCDMVAATLIGDYRSGEAAPRSVCAMGHKWMWNPTVGWITRRRDFLSQLDPLFDGIREKLDGRVPHVRCGCRRLE